MSALFACDDELVQCSLLVMAKSFVASLVILALNMPSLASAAAPAPLILKPTSAWQVDYANERCRLARQFGEGKQTVFLIMDRFAPTDSLRLTISGPLVKTFVEKGDADIQFGLLAIKNRAKTEWVVVQPISEDRQKAVRHLRVGKPLRKPVMLETGSMRGPLSALDTCIDNLLTSWGVDIEKHKTLGRAVTPLDSPEKWIVSSDYPSNMLSAGQPALVNFRLSIGPDGVPTACHIQATTRPKEFDNAVCKSVMRRARFSPALDATGQPLVSYYQNNVYFRLP